MGVYNSVTLFTFYFYLHFHNSNNYCFIRNGPHLLFNNFMNNDVTILKMHMLVISTMQHNMLTFQNDVINVAVFQANLKKRGKIGQTMYAR